MGTGFAARASRVTVAVSSAVIGTVGMAAMFVVVSPASPACAASVPHVALVVGTGTQQLTYCVALDAASVSGIHLVQLAGSQDDLQYRLGFGGQAVCQLAGVGPDGDDCFASYPDFWGFWLGDGSGGWTWSSSGAASVEAHDGDIEAWTWGTGDSGDTHPEPTQATLTDVCGSSPSASPTSSVPPTHSPRASSAASGGASPMPGTTGAASGDVSGSSSPSTHRTSRPETSAQAGDGPTVLAAATGTGGGGSGGPPAGTLIALVAAAALGSAGWLRVRTRRDAGSSHDGSRAPPADIGGPS
ncbi:MAG: hypothetical protein M3P11_01800 [Actinomycetota bacterium]|nr:hypothetical protein [Actinomycetota bacterium]